MSRTENEQAIDIHVGRRVRERRIMQGLSQTGLAERFGITFQQMQKYESGTNRVSASRLWRLSEELDVPVAWFFIGIGEPAEDYEDMSTKRWALEAVRNLQRSPPKVRTTMLSLIKMVALQNVVVELHEGEIEIEPSRIAQQQ